MRQIDQPSGMTLLLKKMKMPPLDFAKDYLMRAGRIDLPQLRKMVPQFMAEYDQSAGVARSKIPYP